MKLVHKVFGIMLCALLLCQPIRAFCEDYTDEPYEETEPEQTVVTTVPETTVPTTLPPETVPAAEPTATQKTVEPPLVRITREDLAKKPKAGDTFTLSVVFHNYSGSVSLRSGLASFEPSEGLVLAENSASKVVPVLEANAVRSVPIRLRVVKDAASANQYVSVTYSYSYKTPDGLVQAEATEKLLVSVTPAADASQTTAAASQATPNVIVTDYRYGGTIAAGDEFSLQLTFRNTSPRIGVENIVMSVETGDGLSITTASNTYYYASLGAGKSRTQSIPMRVAVNANPDGARIDLAFRYEYVDGGTRSSASASERLSIPIYIPDRFSVTEPEMELIGVQNEEISVSLPYVNKSRVEVSNVSAKLMYDEETVFCEQPHVNLGNFEPGKSGTIDFYFMPLEAGDGTVTVQISYEDELTQEKTLEIRVPYSAEAGYVDPGMEEPTDFPEEEQTGPGWLRFAIPAAALVVVLVVVVLIVRRRKKKKAAEPSVDFNWDVPHEVESHEVR